MFVARAMLKLAFQISSSCLLAFAILAGFAGEARGTPEYPIVLDATYGTSCPNPNSRCIICHSTARGGQATAVRPFAQTLRRFGLNRGRDATLLQSALSQLSQMTDSDEDGTPDVDELMMCGNPSGEDLGAGPEYGCDGAHLAARLPEPEDAPLALIALLAAGVIVRRRRVPSAR